MSLDPEARLLDVLLGEAEVLVVAARDRGDDVDGLAGGSARPRRPAAGALGAGHPVAVDARGGDARAGSVSVTPLRAVVGERAALVGGGARVGAVPHDVGADGDGRTTTTR